jgi:hypothetical protein
VTAPDKPDLARGWKSVEKLVDQEADRVAALSDAEFDREMSAVPAPASVPSVDELLRKAKARAADDPEGVRAIHRAVAAKDDGPSTPERAPPRPAAARAARRWAPSVAVAASVLFALWNGHREELLGSAPGDPRLPETHGTPWVDHVSYLFAGVFLVNAIPHLVSGLMGRAFQTPFADPPGEGLSSSTVNVLWGALNLVVAYLLFRVGPFHLGDVGHVAAAGAGALGVSLVLARRFGRFHGGNTG